MMPAAHAAPATTFADVVPSSGMVGFTRMACSTLCLSAAHVSVRKTREVVREVEWASTQNHTHTHTPRQ